MKKLFFVATLVGHVSFFLAMTEIEKKEAELQLVMQQERCAWLAWKACADSVAKGAFYNQVSHVSCQDPQIAPDLQAEWMNLSQKRTDLEAELKNLKLQAGKEK